MFWMHVPLVQNDFLFCWHAFAVHGFDSRDYAEDWGDDFERRHFDGNFVGSVAWP